MRNLTPGPKFSVLLAIVLLITLAVWPIGFAKAEKNLLAENQKEKRDSKEAEISVKTHRSAQAPDKKWETGTDMGEDDDLYTIQSDPSGSDSYEGDGYGYDDDEYDHFNYKRYDTDKSKLNRDVKMSNEEDRNALGGEKRASVVLPEATTIELLSFQAKNLNPMAENMQSPKEEPKMKPFSLKKLPYSEKSQEKEPLVEEKLKKKTSEEQKPDSNASDKNTGNVKASENKVSGTKEIPENKVEKGKESDSGTNGQANVQNLKEKVHIADSKGNSPSVSDGKNEAKIAEKDLKAAEVKIEPDEKGALKMKAEKDMDARISDSKADTEVSTDESKEKNLSQFTANLLGKDYKDGFDNVNDPVIADDEKGSEDNGMNLAGLRDSRNELPYQYPNVFRFGNYLRKKEAGKQMASKHSGRASNILGKESGGKTAKEPFHLDFPVADLENNDYHQNYMNSLKRFKNMDESARILGQGDTPNPYADEAKMHLASDVIEEEQRKRRSRLRRLKANPMFVTTKKRDREEEENASEYECSPPARMSCGMIRRNIYEDGYIQPAKKCLRRGSHILRDIYSNLDQFNEGMKNVKNKRQDDAGFYTEEEESYAEKRKGQGKSGWGGGENSRHKKKLKDTNSYEEPNRYNTPLVLLQRNDNGQQAMKTFVDGRYKNEEGINTEDLARLLSRDSNYVVLKKVPGREQMQALDENGRSRSAIGDSRREKYKITHLDLTMNANHPTGVQGQDIGKLVGALTEPHVERPLKRKENRIEDLSDFFKGDVQDDKELDEKKEMMMSIDNRLNQYQRGEPNKKMMYKPSLSQVYRHMNNMDESESVSDSAKNLIRLADKKVGKLGNGGQNSERLLASFKTGGKEFLLLNKPFGTMSEKGKGPDAIMQNSVEPGMTNAVPGATATNIVDSGNLAQMSQVFSNGMIANGGSMAPASMYANAMMPGNVIQEMKLPEVAQKGADSNRKYFLYGSENGIASAPKHDVMVAQGDFSLPPGSAYNAQKYDQQTFNAQTYNKASPMKNAQGGKAQSCGEARDRNQYAKVQQPYDYGKTKQCKVNGFQLRGINSAAAENFKRVTKKDDSCGGLERFMRDFQDFSQASYPNTFKSTDLTGMSLRELTGHGDKHFQKLNTLLNEIMNNKVEENGGGRSAKNLKRGIFQKYKDQKDWQVPGGGGDAQVRSGKWTSVINDGSNQMGYSDKSTSPGESFLKDRKFERKDAAAMLSQGTLFSKRTKRQSGYDSKDSTKILEQKVKSTPYHVQPQPLFPNTNAMGNTNNGNQQRKSPSRACLQLPPDKLMELLNFLRSEREDSGAEETTKDCLCRRNAPADEMPPFRKLLTLNEDEALGEKEKRRAECVRKSFKSYLDPLVRKLGEHEVKTNERKRRRAKREIELDESMPNDFQNFLVTSLGGVSSQKREVVKKDEAVWDSAETREEKNLGKRDTSGIAKDEIESVPKEDATNIRIKIVDGNGNGEHEEESSEGDGMSRKVKAAAAESNGDSSVHEVYLIANADTKRRKKKKFASVGSDQSPQKQPISNHLPQVETVYNPSPGSNKAQVEKIINSDAQMKGKCAQPPRVYNATASMMEDNIIRNNLRTGNINTFTYQQKEEPTPFPVQGPTNPPSSEFEMLNSKSLSRSKPFGSRAFDYGDHYASSNLANAGPEIVYKDETPNNGVRQGYRSNPVVRVLKNGMDGFGDDRYRKEYAEEESSYAEYEDGDGSVERQADSDYEEHDAERQENRRQDGGEYHETQEHLDPKMVALWHDYARTHLSPERHKEAMEREFQEAYFRSGQARYVGGNANQPTLGVNFIQNLNPNDFDRLDKQKAREKLSKRLATESNISRPIQIGRRFFYTFKSDVPDEEYYALYQEPSKVKSLNENAQMRIWNNLRGVRKLTNRQPSNYNAVVKRNCHDMRENRVKRSVDGTKSMQGSRMKKRLSSGHLTENRYRKYHRKNFNVKRKVEKRGRVKRDSLADFLKADMMRRIEEEKKVRSRVKGLSSDLTKGDIPLIGSLSPTEDASLPELLLQRLEEERKKEKMTEQNRYLEDQRHKQFGNLKTGNPDVFKTFEIKRGRREEQRSGAAPPEGGRLAIADEAESDSYQDRIFLKGVRARKVNKYSDEGFEPLTPDARFSEKSSFYLETKKDCDGPYRVPLDKKESPSSGVNRRAGVKMSKLKDAGAGGLVKLQKLTHGFSHEAPLLTPNTPLNSPKIFDALKDVPPQRDDLSLGKHPAEASVPVPVGARLQLKSSKESAVSAQEPLVSAVLVLTKREEPNERRIQMKSPRQLAGGSDAVSGEKEGKPSQLEKRRAEWLKDAGGGDSLHFRPVAQSPEIVNEETECRSCGCETPTKTFNDKMAHNVKQSRFPFRQLHNDRSGGGAGIGNSGEDILESILGRVESNPHFRKVIGPGLKWRGQKCYTEAEDHPERCYEPPSRSLFVRQVRKILARFARDIENLATQDLTRNVCCKLDCRSNKFLHELLDAPLEATGNCKRRKFLELLLREPSTSASRSNIAEDARFSSNAASVETAENRRGMVARLLEEYRSLPDDEKRNVEILGQYLNYELETLNRALNLDEASLAESAKKCEERTKFAVPRDGGEGNPERAAFTSDATHEREKASKRASVKAPQELVNPVKVKAVRDGCGTEGQQPNALMPSPKEPPRTENGKTGDLDESAGTRCSSRSDEARKQPERRLGELDKLGSGDAAGLQQSLKSRGPWLSNLNLKKEKPVNAWRIPGRQSALRSQAVASTLLHQPRPRMPGK